MNWSPSVTDTIVDPKGVTTTIGFMVCIPKSLTVFSAKPIHSMDGSKASLPSASPSIISGLRTSVLFCVDVNPLPHCEPGSVPICPMMSISTPLLDSDMASSPL